MDDVVSVVDAAPPTVTNEDLAQRLDLIGQQLNWLCENLQSLFAFVNQMSASGGGLRGLMSAMKQHEPVKLTSELPEGA